MKKEKIAVIGGGISGITTALTLQRLGWSTTCYTRDLVTGETGDDPRFASLYPAASIIPHSVNSSRTRSLFAASQQLFSHLLDTGFPGVTIHRHYEIFEYPVEPPSYVSLLKNVRSADPADPWLPRRPEAASLSGWQFDCFFTEWPRYIHALYERYRRSGGTIIRREITAASLRSLEEEIVVNCTGVWSSELFGEGPARIVRGHLVSVPEAPLLRDSGGQILSYNYTAGESVYTHPDGGPADVYFYPRTDGWIIGGSRQSGRLGEEVEWDADSYRDTIRMDEVEIPRQILEINREILSHTYSLELDQYPRRIAKTGYRYLGESGELTLVQREQFGRKVIHNYGHGGAGVTLSWGCALTVARMIGNQEKVVTADSDSLLDLARSLEKSIGDGR